MPFDPGADSRNVHPPGLLSFVKPLRLWESRGEPQQVNSGTFRFFVHRGLQQRGHALERRDHFRRDAVERS
jgi:hypothetical protein